MKKNNLVLIPMLMGMLVQAQIGINHADPKSTLDIVGKTDEKSPDGILIPRYTALDLGKKDGAYGADQNGTLVFVTEGTGSSPKTINIKGKGFYYYDAPNSTWKPIRGENDTGPILPGETMYYTETFFLNGSNYQNLSNQPLVKPLPVLDGLMIDVNSYLGQYAYHPRFYNTTVNPITISYSLGYNYFTNSQGSLSIPSSGQWFPFSNSSSPLGSGILGYWGGAYVTNSMVTVMIKDKIYRIEWFCYDSQTGVPTPTKRKVNILITRIG